MSGGTIMKWNEIFKVQTEACDINRSVETLCTDMEETASEATLLIREALEAYYRAEREPANPMVFGIWCIYAGIGAEYIRQNKGVSLNEVDVDAELIGARGITEMDEYVTELAGLDPNVMGRLTLDAAKSGAAAYSTGFNLLNLNEKILQQREFEKACFAFGVKYETYSFGE